MPNAEIETVKAENAPVGVQLWPTITRMARHACTLSSVLVHRNANGNDYVIWTFENGTRRRFAIGEDVGIQLPRT